VKIGVEARRCARLDAAVPSASMVISIGHERFSRQRAPSRKLYKKLNSANYLPAEAVAEAGDAQNWGT